jgi:ribokinase
MEFVTGGGLRIDYTITHDGQANLRQPGGNCVYAAVGVKLWDASVGIWARKGENYRNEWLDTLTQTGIHTEGILTIPGSHDHRTFFAYTQDGRRDDLNPAAHFARINQPLPPDLVDYVDSTPGQDNPDDYETLGIRPEDWPAAYDGVTAVHLAGHGLRSQLTIPPILREKGIRTITLDPGERYMVPEYRQHIRQIVQQADAFLPSEMEIRSLFGEEIRCLDAAQILCAWGAKLVVVKMGAEGVLVVEDNGRYTHLPAFHQPLDPRVIDITGAGDAFCGGFLVGLSRTHDPIHAAQMGLATASIIVEGYGTLYALTRHPQETVHRLQTLQNKI